MTTTKTVHGVVLKELEAGKEYEYEDSPQLQDVNFQQQRDGTWAFSVFCLLEPDPNRAYIGGECDLASLPDAVQCYLDGDYVVG